MKSLFTFILILITLQLFGQTDTTFYSTELEINIISIDFKGSKDKLMDFIKVNQLSIQKQDESKTSIFIKVNVNKEAFEQFNEIVPSFGFVTSRKVNTVNNILTVNDIKLEINYLKAKRDSYNELINKLDNQSEMYITLWNENKIIEEKIFDKEKEILPFLQKELNYNINIEISEEQTSPDNSKVSFINMPGFEYSYLTIESPKFDISSKNYQGYFLKYLFTKGKSFALAGAYKSTDSNIADSSLYSELFILGFGQDFYSRHLGHGERKFFNLYSGYTLGYILATGIKSKSNIMFVSPSIGLEIFKNKYFLIDTKAVYFIPLSNNKNLRGFSFNASFSFVF